MEVKRAAHLKGHQAAIYALAAGAEPHLFFSGDGNGMVIEWNMLEPDKARVVARVPANVFSINYLTGHHLLIIGTMQGGIYLVDLVKKKVVPPFLQLPRAVYTGAIVGEKLYMGNGQGILFVFNLPSMELQKTIKLSKQSVRRIVAHPNQETLAVCCSDNKVYLIDIASNELIQSFVAHENSVFAATYTKDGQYLLTGSRDAHLSIWEVGTEEYNLLEKIPAHMQTINFMTLNPAGNLLATASRDKSVKIWSVPDFKLLKVIDNAKEGIEAHINSVNTLLWSSHYDFLVSAGDDRLVMIWDVQEQAENTEV